MNNDTFYLQGLNFRNPDREAQPGTCRVLSDLYPSGDAQAPVWKPAALPGLFYQHEGVLIRSAFAWHRSNTPSCMIYLAIDGIGGGWICSVGLNDNGSVKSEAPALVYALHHATENTDASFAQMGDTLVIAITENGKAADLFVVSIIDGVTTCLPFNIPDVPMVPIPKSNSILTGAQYYDIATNTFYEYETRQMGFRVGWLLNDGTIARLSSVRVRNVLVPKLSRSVTGDNDITWYMKHITHLEGEAGVIKFGEYSGAIKTPLAIDAKYKGLIKGIALFISEPKADVDECLKSAMYYKWKEFTQIFDAGSVFVDYSIKLDDLLLLPQLEEDNIFNHDIYSANVSSYNKMLLLSDVSYVYRLPSNPDGSAGVNQDTTINSSVTYTTTPYTGGHTIKWTTVSKTVKTTIQAYLKPSADEPYKWVTVYEDTGSEFNYAHTELVQMRLWCEFENEIKSNVLTFSLNAPPAKDPIEY